MALSPFSRLLKKVQIPLVPLYHAHKDTKKGYPHPDIAGRDAEGVGEAEGGGHAASADCNVGFLLRTRFTF